jgi:hypothetical protein
VKVSWSVTFSVDPLLSRLVLQRAATFLPDEVVSDCLCHHRIRGVDGEELSRSQLEQCAERNEVFTNTRVLGVIRPGEPGSEHPTPTSLNNAAEQELVVEFHDVAERDVVEMKGHAAKLDSPRTDLLPPQLLMSHAIELLCTLDARVKDEVRALPPDGIEMIRDLVVRYTDPTAAHLASLP